MAFYPTQGGSGEHCAQARVHHDAATRSGSTTVFINLEADIETQLRSGAGTVLFRTVLDLGEGTLPFPLTTAGRLELANGGALDDFKGQPVPFVMASSGATTVFIDVLEQLVADGTLPIPLALPVRLLPGHAAPASLLGEGRLVFSQPQKRSTETNEATLPFVLSASGTITIGQASEQPDGFASAANYRLSDKAPETRLREATIVLKAPTPSPGQTVESCSPKAMIRSGAIVVFLDGNAEAEESSANEEAISMSGTARLFSKPMQGAFERDSGLVPFALGGTGNLSIPVSSLQDGTLPFPRPMIAKVQASPSLPFAARGGGEVAISIGIGNIEPVQDSDQVASIIGVGSLKVVNGRAIAPFTIAATGVLAGSARELQQGDGTWPLVARSEQFKALLSRLIKPVNPDTVGPKVPPFVPPKVGGDPVQGQPGRLPGVLPPPVKAGGDPVEPQPENLPGVLTPPTKTGGDPPPPADRAPSLKDDNGSLPDWRIPLGGRPLNPDRAPGGTPVASEIQKQLGSFSTFSGRAGEPVPPDFFDGVIIIAGPTKAGPDPVNPEDVPATDTTLPSSTRPEPDPVPWENTVAGA